MKVVINKCFGGFCISDKAFEKYLDLKGVTWFKSKEQSLGSYSYYKVSEEEYKQIEKECDKSPVGTARYSKLNDLHLSLYDIERTDPVLIQVVEEMGKKSFGDFSKLKIVEIPDGVNWEIQEYDGFESIHEVHRVWN